MKQRAYASTFLLCLAIAAAASAGEIAGVKLPDTVTFEGRTLRLNGMGLRKKVVFKVYVAGLYLETPTQDAATVISSNQVKLMELSILRTLKSSQVNEAIREGFEKNSRAQMAALSERLHKLEALIPDVKEGDRIRLTWVPGKGTVVSAKDAEKGVIEGKDFADALFSVWLGPNPVQEDLKKELLRATRGSEPPV